MFTPHFIIPLLECGCLNLPCGSTPSLQRLDVQGNAVLIQKPLLYSTHDVIAFNIIYVPFTKSWVTAKILNNILGVHVISHQRPTINGMLLKQPIVICYTQHIMCRIISTSSEQFSPRNWQPHLTSRRSLSCLQYVNPGNRRCRIFSFLTDAIRQHIMHLATNNILQTRYLYWCKRLCYFDDGDTQCFCGILGSIEFPIFIDHVLLRAKKARILLANLMLR